MNKWSDDFQIVRARLLGKYPQNLQIKIKSVDEQSTKGFLFVRWQLWHLGPLVLYKFIVVHKCYVLYDFVFVCCFLTVIVGTICIVILIFNCSIIWNFNRVCIVQMISWSCGEIVHGENVSKWSDNVLAVVSTWCILFTNNVRNMFSFSISYYCMSKTVGSIYGNLGSILESVGIVDFGSSLWEIMAIKSFLRVIL